MFQSLIGTIKTCMSPYLYINPSYVSIPYRYDKNRTVVPAPYIRVAGFQSLIGTIKTCSHYFWKCSGLWFQSLIGTIKTSDYPGECVFHDSVSIPYRYDKNALVEASVFR